MFNKVRRSVALAIVCTITFIYHTWFSNSNQLNFYLNLFSQLNSDRTLPSIKVCQVPQLNPFNASILKLISKLPNPRTSCSDDDYQILFNSSVNPYPQLIPVWSPEEFRQLGVSDCYYRNISRGNEYAADLHSLIGKTKFAISLTENTNISSDNFDHIAIYCRVHKVLKLLDVHAFVRVKPDEYYIGNALNESRLNVIILGLDSVSRMNFHRNFPLTRKYLMDNLSAVEMTAYNKIGGNTFPNIAPMLTNMPTIDQDYLDCEVNTYFDQCPLIWKDFARAGYKTLFTEDLAVFSIFNRYKQGFHFQPTDYYPRPVFQIGATIGKIRRGRIWTQACLGPRTAFHVMIDYMKQMSWQMKYGPSPRNYFQFAWSSSITHDLLNGGQVIDKYIMDTLQWWHLGGYLNNTVFVLMSDHGWRRGEFRRTVQGQLEDQLPFMYLVMPPSFSERYPEYWQNLLGNRDSLITALDLYQTLRDILLLSNPQFNQHPISSGIELKSGISLFSKIPANRTCTMAGVPEEYCTCGYQMESVDVQDSLVQEAVYIALQSINKYLQEFRQCKALSLFKILDAQVSADLSNYENKRRFRVAFQTVPGHATFEAFVLWFGDNNWRLSEEVLRTNLYEKQSECVSNIKAKRYCYCTNLLV